MNWLTHKRGLLLLAAGIGLGANVRLRAENEKTITIQDPKYKVRETEKTVELTTPFGPREIIGGVGKDAYKYRIEIPLESLKPTPTPTPDPDELKAAEEAELQRMVNSSEITVNKTINKTDNTDDDEEDEEEDDKKAKRKPAMVKDDEPPAVPTPEYDDTERLVLEANHLYNKGKFYEASLYVEELIRKKPTFPRAWVMKGSLLYVLGMKDLAKQAWQKAQTLAPTDQEVKDLLQRYR